MAFDDIAQPFGKRQRNCLLGDAASASRATVYTTVSRIQHDAELLGRSLHRALDRLWLANGFGEGRFFSLEQIDDEPLFRDIPLPAQRHGFHGDRCGQLEFEPRLVRCGQSVTHGIDQRFSRRQRFVGQREDGTVHIDDKPAGIVEQIDVVFHRLVEIDDQPCSGQVTQYAGRVGDRGCGGIFARQGLRAEHGNRQQNEEQQTKHGAAIGRQEGVSVR